MTTLLTPAQIAGATTTPLGLGTARLGAFWQRRGVREGLATVEAALDLGITLVDTADVYARGIAERLVGRAVRRRPDVTVMTKVGLLKTPAGIASAVRHGGSGVGVSGLRAATAAATCFEAGYVVDAARACVRRQERDALDVLLLHEPGVEDLARGAFLEGIDRLKREGTVRAWGASVRDAASARAALDLPGLTWLQLPVNATSTSALDAVADHPRAAEVAIVAIAALGDGALVPRALDAGAPSAADAVAGLVESAAAPDLVDAVLLGMSSPDRVLHNVAALHRGRGRTPSWLPRLAGSQSPARES